MPYLGWLEGDLDAVDRHSIQLLSIGERFDQQDTIATAHYFLGISAYERNRLHEADEHLGATLDLRLVTQTVIVVHAEIALALSQLAQGRGDEADDTAAATMQYVLDERSEFLQPVVLGFLAELDLRRGRHASALRWAQTADLDVDRHRYVFYDLPPTLIGALLTSPDDAVRGSELLEEALEAATLHNHVPLTLSLLGLNALRLAEVGEEAKALDALKSAVALSQKAGMVRRLADRGPALVPLLSRLDIAGEDLEHAGAIVGAIGSPTTSDARVETPADVVTTFDGGPSLTGRELDVLRLLADRLSNKEIARELFIAPATVKKRTVTLYDKLNVHHLSHHL
jgi:LuxR family maltose regulon positive regulatory protein